MPLKAEKITTGTLVMEQILTDELLKDKQESILDIAICKAALKIGITTCSGGSVQERLEINQKIVDKINKELLLRRPNENPGNKFFHLSIKRDWSGVHLLLGIFNIFVFVVI